MSLIWALYWYALPSNHNGIPQIVLVQHLCFAMSIVTIGWNEKIFSNNMVIPLLMSCVFFLSQSEYDSLNCSVDLTIVGTVFSLHASLDSVFKGSQKYTDLTGAASSLAVFSICCSLFYFVQHRILLWQSILCAAVYFMFYQTGMLEKEISSMLLVCSICVTFEFWYSEISSIQCVNLSILTFVSILVSIAVSNILCIFALSPQQAKWIQILSLIGGVFFMFFVISNMVVRRNFIHFVVDIITANGMMITMFSLYWVIIILISVGISVFGMERLHWSRVWGRKVFHFAIVGIILPTLFFPEMSAFLSLSLGGIVCVFVILEYLRIQVFPIEFASVSVYFEQFLVSHEVKNAKHTVIMAHFSLVVSCAYPIWSAALIGNSSNAMNCSLELLSILPLVGVVCVGVSDSAAAIIGSSYGKIKWPGQQKSYLGSASGFLSLFLSLYFISFFTYPSLRISSLLLASLLTSLSEVFVSGTDNFCLPVVLIFSYICSCRVLST